MKSSPSYSTFNSEQNDILFSHLHQIFVMHSIPEGNNVTLNGKLRSKLGERLNAREQTKGNTLIDICNGRGALKWVYVKNQPILSQNLRKPPKPPISKCGVGEGQ